MSTDEEAGGWRLVAVVLGSVALACIVLSVGLEIVQASVEFGSGEGFEQLGEILLTLVATILAGVTTLVVSVVVGVGRTVSPERRGRAVATILVAVAAVVAAWMWASANARRADLDALDWIVPLVVLASAAAAIGAVAGLLPRRPVVALVAGVVTGLAVVVVLVERQADDVVDEDRAAHYERAGAPLALLDGTDLDAADLGWEFENVVGGYDDDEISVRFVDGEERIALTFDPDPDLLDCHTGICEELGRRSDGRQILGRRGAATTSDFSPYRDIWVDVDGGRWHVSLRGGGYAVSTAVAMLQALEPVDAETFVAAR